MKPCVCPGSLKAAETLSHLFKKRLVIFVFKALDIDFDCNLVAIQ